MCIVLCLQFISCDVYGVFCSAFCDFGDSFEVTDINGEEPRDIFIESISKVWYMNFTKIHLL